MKSLTRLLTYLSLLFASALYFSCENKFYKKKFDINYLITNKTDSTIQEVKVNANNGEKVWVFKNISPGKRENLTFNIKRDLRTPEGNITIFAIFNKTDSVYLSVSYFTNWQYLDQNPASFNIYNDRIEEVK